MGPTQPNQSTKKNKRNLSIRERIQIGIENDNGFAARQCQELEEWLLAKYEAWDEEPPLNVEMCDHEFEQLLRMMKQNKEMDRLAKLRIDEAKQLKFEYESEGARLQNILDFVGLPAHVLSSAGKASLKNLTDLASVLKIKDAQESTYCISLLRLKEEIERTEEEIIEKEKDVEKLNHKLVTCKENLKQINDFYQNKNEASHVNIPLLQKRQKETHSMHQKCVKYEEQMSEMKEQEDVIRNFKKFHHETLVQLHQDLMDMKTELQPFEEKYKRYKTLPPDINLAKVKVAEVKRQLILLEQKLQCDIDALAL